MVVNQQVLARRAGDYGVDAPYVPAGLGAGGLALLALAAYNGARHTGPFAVAACAIGGVWLLASAACYLYTTRAGKFAVWTGLFRGLGLRGDEVLMLY